MTIGDFWVVTIKLQMEETTSTFNLFPTQSHMLMSALSDQPEPWTADLGFPLLTALSILCAP